jgi:predicted adenylyl cyclase CyaB
LRKYLNERSINKYILFQDEIYFDNPYSSFIFLNSSGHKDALKYLRLRTVDEIATLCLKEWIPDANNNLTSCIENETVVNKNQMINILSSLGFTSQYHIKKKREDYYYENMKISIDEVETMGIFVEIEAITHDGNIEAVRNNIYSFLEQCGIHQVSVVERGYLFMIWNSGVNYMTTTNLKL